MTPSSAGRAKPAHTTGRDGEDRWRRILESSLGPPFTSGNSIEVLRNGDQIFPAMLDAIGKAQRRIEFLTFIYWTGDIATRLVDALCERASSGVEVLVLLDGFGAKTMERDLLDRLDDAGCRVQWFRPLSRWRVWHADNRTHRKILVCDGEVGFTGGVGIAAEWEGDADSPDHWRDNHFMIRGPAVRGLRAAFYGDWMEQSGTISALTADEDDTAPAGDVEMQVVLSQSAAGWNASARMQDALIRLARERVRIQTPYLSPGRMQTEALCEALERGVTVEIMCPGPHIDKRLSEYSGSWEIKTLLDAGITLYRYQPTVLHSKLITVDGVVSSVGTANFNERSVFQDNEVCVNVLDRDFTAQMDTMFEADREHCKTDTVADWNERGFMRRAAEFGARLVKRET